jgi:hypothetical protein
MHWSFTLKFWCESSMYTEVLMWKFNVHWSFDVKVQCIEVSHWSFDLKVQCTELFRLKFYIEVLTWKFNALNFSDWSFTLKFQTVVRHWNFHIEIFEDNLTTCLNVSYPFLLHILGSEIAKRSKRTLVNACIVLQFEHSAWDILFSLWFPPLFRVVLGWIREGNFNLFPKSFCSRTR